MGVRFRNVKKANNDLVMEDVISSDGRWKLVDNLIDELTVIVTTWPIHKDLCTDKLSEWNERG